MPNYCDYEMKIKGTKKNCEEWLSRMNDYEKELFKKVLHRDIDEIYSAEGCEICGNGYKGRIAIHEVLIVDQKIKDAISSNLRKEQLRKLVYTSDVTTLLQDGLEKVVEGYTTFEEVLKIFPQMNYLSQLELLENIIKEN